MRKVPELPEAEVLSRELQKKITGKRIVDVDARQPKALNLPPNELKRRAQGRVRDVTRRAKSVVIQYEGNGRLWLHLGLRTSAGWARASEVPASAFLKLVLDDGHAFYMDKTFMGKALYFTDEEYSRRWNEYGPEPLDPGFTPHRLEEILQSKPNSSIKTLLMDQEQIAGIGNVYSDEILFVARIRPDRKASSLSDNEIEKLFQAIRQVLREAIEKGGSPEWTDFEGHVGEYVPRVHGAATCPECGREVKKISLGGRTAYLCEKCQR